MRISFVLLAAGGLAMFSSSALADRHPNAGERDVLERALQAEGFVSWGEIELDDGHWEVDDARTGNATEGRFDLKLDPNTIKIISRKHD